jgi:alpha-glucosidase
VQSINSPQIPIRKRILLRWIVALLLPLPTVFGHAQMLAKPGIIGSGRGSADLWWKQAVFYQVAGSAAPDFKAISARLDSLRSLGVDALILPAPALPAPGTSGVMPNLDDLDALLRQSSSRGIRILLTIQASGPTANLSGVARFWLTRGVAGLRVAAPAGTSPEETAAIVQTLRKLESASAGQRIVISDLDLDSSEAATARKPSAHTIASHARAASSSAAQLQIDLRPDRLQTLDAANLRSLLEQAIAQPNRVLDLRAPGSPAASTDARSPLAYAIAAIALLSEPVALIDSSADLALATGPEHAETPDRSEQPVAAPLPPPPAPPPGVYLPYVPYVPPPKPKPIEAPKPIPVDPLTSWYQKLAALHHDNAMLRAGNKTFLDFDAQDVLAWVSRPVRPSPQTPPIMVLCNLSSSPVQLSLAAEIKKLNLRGFFLRAVLRSDAGMGAQDINAVNLPPYGVYIGELRF